MLTSIPLRHFCKVVETLTFGILALLVPLLNISKNCKAAFCLKNAFETSYFMINLSVSHALNFLVIEVRYEIQYLKSAK